MMDRKALHFLPLGGAGEVGMNLSLYACEGAWIMVDLGLTFADDSLPGVDLLLPNPAFIAERRKDLLGLILTHAHEDHIGAVAYLWPDLECPIFATPFTASLLRAKLDEAGLLGRVPLTVVPPGGLVELDPFRARFVPFTHSIPEAHALHIETPYGAVFHSGDWKLDPDPLIGATVDEAALAAIGDAGLHALICDSTNAFREGVSGSEGEVRTSLRKLIGEVKGGLAVTTFASNVARLVTIAEAGQAAGRAVSLIGRSMHRIVAAARENGYLPKGIDFLPPEEAVRRPRSEVLYLCTGCQGEPRGAMARIAEGQYRDIALEAGDTVIFSSKIIPGNETRLVALHNKLAAASVDVITEQDHFVHVSGHPCRDELRRLYGWLRPEVAVPVHGEARHLAAQASLARELGVRQVVTPHNGALVRLAPGKARIVDEVPTGRLAVDGDAILDASDSALSERRKVMYNGHAVVTLACGRNGQVLGEPGVVLCGVPERVNGVDLAREMAEAVEKAVASLKKRERGHSGAIEQAARLSARQACQRISGKRPLIKVHVMRIER